ncbi:MAG: hypothetical protein V4687_16040 [Bacteroidota bacterium]
MSEKLVRIKKLKTGEHMMVTPAYAARTKMLKNSGWVVEDLPEKKQIVPQEIYDNAPKILAEIKEILNPIDTFDEALTEKETGLSLDDQPQETIDLWEVKEELKPKTRGRQPGTKNKVK